jgi:hypothetical protein
VTPGDPTQACEREDNSLPATRICRYAGRLAVSRLKQRLAVRAAAVRRRPASAAESVSRYSSRFLPDAAPRNRVCHERNRRSHASRPRRGKRRVHTRRRDHSYRNESKRRDIHFRWPSPSPIETLTLRSCRSKRNTATMRPTKFCVHDRILFRLFVGCDAFELQSVGQKSNGAGCVSVGEVAPET